MIDVIYVAASTRDARYTRSCVASIRSFYPDTRIELLVGGPLQLGLEGELARHFSVGVADFVRADYGWGFVKLEPLFRRRGERFLVLDSDTVLAGPVCSLLRGDDADFLVDEEEQSAQRSKEIYYDPERAGPDGGAVAPPRFLFNSGQWFGRSGLISRNDFHGLVEWTYPRRLYRPDVFKNGDQGVLNFVVNEQERLGRIRVSRVPLMRWPGHGLDGIDVENVAAGHGPPVVVHWAGMKKRRLGEMTGGELLLLFERRYYDRLSFGTARRAVDLVRHVAGDRLASLERRLARRVRA